MTLWGFLLQAAPLVDMGMRCRAELGDGGGTGDSDGTGAGSGTGAMRLHTLTCKQLLFSPTSQMAPLAC